MVNKKEVPHSCCYKYLGCLGNLVISNRAIQKLAGWTGLEPAAFRVTGGRYNQLNYHPAPKNHEVGNLLKRWLRINT